MNFQKKPYSTLCSVFYDATKKYAPEKEVLFYASFIEKFPGRVLEAMSGSGRLQIPLIQRGYIVDGIDSSAIMLDRCRKRCAHLELHPDLYEQSLEELNLPQKYATITIAVGSFQLIVDRASALRALSKLHAHMHNGGNLLIDIFVPDMNEKESEVRVARIDQHTIVRLTTRHIFYEQERRADALCFYELITDGMVREQESEIISVTWYTDDELKALLAMAGFTLVNIYEESFRSSGPSRIVHAQAL